MTYEPGEFLRRYKTGEREAVWREMTALGDAVRSPPYFDDAWAAARETMQRAAKNVRTLIQRLDALGYQFWDGEQNTPASSQTMLASVGGRIVTRGSPMEQAKAALAMDVSHIPGGGALKQMLEGLMGPYQAMSEKAERDRQARIAAKSAIRDRLRDPGVFGPPTADEINFIRGLEAKGMFLPLSWRAWLEEVGDVNLAGAHPKLCFWEGPGFPGVYADPLMVTLDHFSFEIESWEEEHDDGASPEGFDAVVAWDPEAKARLAVERQQLDDGRTLAVPNRAADGALRLGRSEIGFVDYLRQAFQWGGFPGWASHPNPPLAELNQLTEGLLPI